MPNLRGGTQHAVFTISMDVEALCDRSSSLVDAENWLALGAGAVLLLVGASRRSTAGACLAVSSAPLLYRGITGRWPAVLNGAAEPDSTRTARGRTSCSRPIANVTPAAILAEQHRRMAEPGSAEKANE